jgi:hypothetical protein
VKLAHASLRLGLQRDTAHGMPASPVVRDVAFVTSHSQAEPFGAASAAARPAKPHVGYPKQQATSKY